jgi:hypothetical protein
MCYFAFHTQNTPVRHLHSFQSILYCLEKHITKLLGDNQDLCKIFSRFDFIERLCDAYSYCSQYYSTVGTIPKILTPQQKHSGLLS